MSNYVVIQLDAGQDRNGNPRRVFVVLEQKLGVIAAIDEGYYGYKAIDKDPEGDTIRALFDCPLKDSSTNSPFINAVRFNTTPMEYKNLLKEYGPFGPGRPKGWVRR